MITIQSVTLRNFMSHADTYVYLNQPGPTLVTGRNLDSESSDSNGSGKSAIFEAVGWGLFGRTLRGIESKAVVRGYPDHIDGGCCVTVEFTSGDDAYKVERYEGAKKNALIFEDPNDDTTERTKAEVQERIQEVLGVDYDLFVQSTVLGQDAFVFAGATDAEKKRILEHVAGVKQFDIFLANAKDQRDDLDGKQEVLRSKILSFKQSAGGRELDLVDAKRDEAEFERTRQRRLKERDDELLAVDIDALADRREELTTEISALEKKTAKKTAAKEALTRRRVEVKEASKLMAEASALVCRRAEDLAGAEARHKAIKDACPTCKRPFDAKSQADARAEIAEEINGLRPAVAGAEELLEEAAENFRCLEEAEGKLVSAFDQIEQAEEALHKAEVKLSALDKDANVADRIQSERADLAEEVNPHTKRIVSCGAELEDLQAQLAKAESVHKGNEEELHLLRFWVAGFGSKGVRSYVMDYVADYLTERANFYSEYLTDGQVEIVFTTQKQIKSGDYREDFQVQAYNDDGAEVYAGNSVGERQRVDMCVALALQELIRSRTGSCIDLFVGDEAAANLDVEGSERMMNLLQDIAAGGKPVWYVTHDARMQELFQERVTVVKKGGVSMIEA